jgi:hypothetical protein
MLYGKYLFLVMNILFIVCAEQYMVDFYVNGSFVGHVAMISLRMAFVAE